MKTNSRTSNSAETVVTVERCYSLAAYDAAKALLESHGIQVWPDSENTISVYPWYANAIGGIRIKVTQADAERARAALEIRRAETRQPIDPKKIKTMKTALYAALALGATTGIAIGLLSGSVALGIQTLILLGFISFILIAHILGRT